MVLNATLFLDQVLEERLPRDDIGASRMNRAQVAWERRDMRIVFDRIVLQPFERQRAPRPGLVKRMLEQRPLGSHRIKSCDYITRHWEPSPNPGRNCLKLLRSMARYDAQASRRKQRHSSYECPLFPSPKGRGLRGEVVYIGGCRSFHGRARSNSPASAIMPASSLGLPTI